MNDLVFPDHGDPQFQEKIAELEEFQILAPPPTPFVATLEDYKSRVDQYCGGFEKMLYQHLVQQYLSHRTPYRGLLLYHGLGVGKTCSAITIAEGFLSHNIIQKQRKGDSPIWVVLPQTLQDGFQQEIFQSASLLKDSDIFDQCTGDTYRRMVHHVKEADLEKKIVQWVRRRYKMMTYDGFASEVEDLKKKGILEEVLTNKVIIIDEAHNLRTEETDKRAADALLEVATTGVNTRITLLSATPMYDKADEILWLLSVLTANDGRTFPIQSSLYHSTGKRNEENFKLLRQLSSEYISYIKGTNPFTFAVRLSPKDSNIPIYTRPSWTRTIRDGLISSPMTSVQAETMSTLKKSDATFRQAANICYPSAAKVAEKGFFGVFERLDQQDPLQVKYIQSKKDALLPGPKLASIAPKINQICSLIRQSEGLVVIYSQFIWSGVLPMAIALEHMGFTRYGAPNIVRNATVEHRVTYPDIPAPTYCILSGDRTVMGNLSIPRIVDKIKDRSNIHGQKIKVVIMSPVAGEGLSLRNVREVHVLDPWYHFNLLEQVIGRAIRTCSHTMLPVEERNVTVFLHALTHEDQETIDLRSYEIAATKLSQTEEVQSLIKNHSMDCPLLKNVNFIPKSTFGFDVVLRTSRGVGVPYHFGDQDHHAPACKVMSKHSNQMTMRKEVVQHLVPTGLQRLRKFFLARPNESAWTADQLIEFLQLHKTVARIILAEAIESPEFIPGYRLQEHRKTIRKVPIPPQLTPSKVIISKQRKVVEIHDKMDTIAQKSTKDSIVAIIDIYKAFEPNSWTAFAKKVLELGSALPASISRHVELLANQGAFIRSRELPSLRNTAPYIGYINIFNSNALTGIVYDAANQLYRELLPSEVETLQRNRIEVQRPSNQMLYGVLEPQESKGEIKTFEIKLWLPEETAGKRRGVVCSSLNRNDILRYLSELKKMDPEKKKPTKDSLCLTLGETLLRNNRLLIYPLWKPT